MRSQEYKNSSTTSKIFNPVVQTEPNPGHSYFTTLLGNVTKSYPKFSVPIFVVGFLKVFAPPRGFRISIIPNLTNFQLSTCVLQFIAKHTLKSYKSTNRSQYIER